MVRNAISIRSATREDAPDLVELWSESLRRADRSEQIADLELVIKQAAASPDQRLIVVECNGAFAGAVLLRLLTLSPVNLEPCVQSIQPRVLARFGRQGVGRAMMEAAASFAEENGVLVMSTSVPASDRDANRFMARLGFNSAYVWRVAPTAVVRSRLDPAPSQRRSNVSRSRVMAARRSARRRTTEPVELDGLAD
ncbi:GNAT family N-acetyltransferase [Nocardioides sambongensis]|uniref:GNAT family N-acetyltransferase n=1 Tax=Nocardioides sambongensis TaxID=2589074 RepID=UPI001E3FF495|nr:GNAT family N-acetyltransferase [Nocardioides sambongensis]